MSVEFCVFICMYVSVLCVYKLICVHKCLCVCMHMYVCVCQCACVYVYVCVLVSGYSYLYELQRSMLRCLPQLPSFLGVQALCQILILKLTNLARLSSYEPHTPCQTILSPHGQNQNARCLLQYLGLNVLSGDQTQVFMIAKHAFYQLSHLWGLCFC